jgi:hypothetical protein
MHANTDGRQEGNAPELGENMVAIDRRHLIDLAGFAEQVLADHLEDQAINAAYEAAGVDPEGPGQ